jgi:hypothetical protein
MTSHADYISSEQYSVDELRAALFGDNPNLAPALALALLGRKDYAERDDDMQRLLLSEDTLPRLRLTAAQALGESGDQKAQGALLSALNTRNPVVLRGVVTALGRRGGRVLVDNARGLDPQSLNRAVLLQVRRAAYLLDLDGFDLPSLDDTSVLPDRDTMQPILSEPAPRDLVQKAIRDLEQEGLPIALAPESALRLQCFDQELVLLLNASVGDAEGSNILRRRAFAGVIATLEEVETERYTPRYHILTQPAKNGVQITLVTDNGTTAFAGEGTLQDGALVFSLRAVDQPGAHAAVIEGVFESGRVRFTRALSSLEQQPRSTPQRRG